MSFDHSSATISRLAGYLRRWHCHPHQRRDLLVPASLQGAGRSRSAGMAAGSPSRPPRGGGCMAPVGVRSWPGSTPWYGMGWPAHFFLSVAGAAILAVRACTGTYGRQSGKSVAQVRQGRVNRWEALRQQSATSNRWSIPWCRAWATKWWTWNSPPVASCASPSRMSIMRSPSRWMTANG